MSSYDENEEIERALAHAREHAEQGNGAEMTVRAVLPLVGIMLKDLRRLAAAAERIAEAADPSRR